MKRKYASTILTFISAAGVIATTALAIEATPRAIELIVEAEGEKGTKLTPLEMVQAAWKPYIPAVVSGLSTIACIFGANYLNTRTQASLMSAYAVLDNSYKEYRKKVNELYESDADNKVRHEIIKNKFVRDMPLDEDKELFFDYDGMQWFQSTLGEVQLAERVLNQMFRSKGYVCVNDFYDILGVPTIEYGYNLGWSSALNDDVYGYSELKFEYEKTELEDGLECWIISMNCSPITL